MAQFSLKGLGVALVTPFTDDNKIDTPALQKLVDSIIKGGADYLVVLGTTGEAPTVSEAEACQIRDCVIKANAGRVPLVIGVGGNDTKSVCERLLTDKFKGFSAILSVVPFYNKPSQAGIIAHFNAICHASPLPVILYNIPGRTGVNMTPDTILRLANNNKNILGIKEASGSKEVVKYLSENSPKGFEIVSGDDELTLEFMQRGAAGVISVIGNLFPRKFSDMVHLACENQFEEAEQIHQILSPIYPLLFKDGNPAGIKAFLAEKGMINNILRLPLVPVSPSTQDEIKTLMKHDR